MDKIRILVVDDCAISRKGIEILLSPYEKLEVTGEAEDGLQALDLIRRTAFDVILMDVNMPDLDGIETTKKMIQIDEKLKILSNSSNRGVQYIRDMIKAGASGYITKGDDAEDYREALWTVVNGGVYLSEEISSETYNKVFVDLKNSKKW